MSKLDALLITLILVGTASGILIVGMHVILILMTLKPISLLALGLGVLLIILISIGIYQYDKHYLN
ncbi:hypothetical protein EF326P1_00022 [Enterococcus phage EF326P1]|nr:hypothetical protein EF326P1_00022 [Enterococcus phage EF326P1]